MLINPTQHPALRRLQGDRQQLGNPKLASTIPPETKNSIAAHNTKNICTQF
jgi:hypothetical protein